MAKLVTRFYDPTEGRVLIDGHDLRDVTLESLRRQLGVVPQEPFLFAGTMRDNIAFARPDATDDEVWEAVARGRAHRAGRAPARRPRHRRPRARPVAVVGRAPAARAGPRVPGRTRGCSCSTRPRRTSTCSPRRKIEAALDVLLEGRTAILIAHRLSTAMRADRIVGRRRRTHRRGRLPRRARRRAAAATPRCTPPGPATRSAKRRRPPFSTSQRTTRSAWRACFRSQDSRPSRRHRRAGRAMRAAVSRPP